MQHLEVSERSSYIQDARCLKVKRNLQEVGGDCGDWMERAQDRDRWRTLVNTVMNFGVP
jgi:hypothetical protein